jgi:hypothetical protein
MAFSLSLHAMDDGETPFEQHRAKFQATLRTIRGARRAQVGLPVEEVQGMFGNALSVPVSVYYNGSFYKEVASRTEIVLYKTDSFAVYIPSKQKTMSQTGSCKQYFYSVIHLDADNDPHIMIVEELQNLHLGTTPINTKTDKEHPLDAETRAAYLKKLEFMKQYNL